MPIPASKIVAVYPRLIKPGSTDLEIAGLFLTKNQLVPFPAVLSFDSKEAVKNYFGAESREYDLSAKYFLGYDNSFSKPRTLYFARRVDKDIPAFLQGASINSKLEDFKAITKGSFSIKISNNTVNLTDVNLSSATSFSAVAEILQTYLRTKSSGAIVTWSSLTQAFTVTSGTAGAGSSINYADDGGLAQLLKLREADGGIISVGSPMLKAGANMDSIISQTQNFVTFSTVYEVDEEEALGLGRWSNEQGEEYLYCLWSMSSLLSRQEDNSSIAVKIFDENLSGVTGVFGQAQYAAFIMGTAASINWNRRNGTINFAFKSQTGLAATVTDGNIADILNKKTFNFYGRYATRNDSFIFLYNGCMFGEWGFIDPYINGIWLRNAIQAALMSGLKQSPRTPYTYGGYTMIRAWLTDPLERALTNGVIEAGVSLSASQKAELFQEAGLDISTEIFVNGYYLQILDPPAVVRVKRDSPIINLWYSYGGSINRLEVPVSAIL